MNIDRLRHDWERWGRTDPLYAILTDPRGKGGRWDQAEFFALGVRDIENMLGDLDRLGLSPRRGKALDFGCGVGRLTQALARHFDAVTGVDISAAMIERARRFNGHGARCAYLVNTRPDLGVLPDANFDLVCTVLTLQHMEPSLAAGYVREFVRVLRPGGILVFQVMTELRPDEVPASGLKGRLRAATPDSVLALYRRLRNAVRTGLLGRPAIGDIIIPLFAFPSAAVTNVLAEAGATVRDAQHAPVPDGVSSRYIAVRDRPVGSTAAAL